MWRMARIAAVLGVGILALAPAAAREASLPADSEAKAPSPLLGIAWNEGRASLVSLDPRSLRPISGRKLSLFGAGAWAYSPDRTRLALAGPCQIGNGLSAGITFVDVARLRRVGCLWLGGVTSMLWSGPRRLLVLTSEVISIDPVSRRVLGRSPLPLGQQLVAVTRAADRIVLLVASGGFGRLVVVDESGAVRSAALELPAGVQPREATFVRPGLAVEAAAGRAFVVPAAGPVAEISLDTLEVAYHELREPVSFLARLSAWLEPAAQAKELPAASRTAVWLGNGKLAVVGDRSVAAGRQEPAGLSLVDTRGWSTRTLDRGIDSFAVSQARIVATGPRAGLAVFDLDGRELYRRFGERAAWVHVIQRGCIYATVRNERRVRVLELATGTQLGSRATPPPRLLLESSG
jgi:hypothetical protein